MCLIAQLFGGEGHEYTLNDFLPPELKHKPTAKERSMKVKAAIRKRREAMEEHDASPLAAKRRERLARVRARDAGEGGAT
jgi:hypothetical protein